MSRILLAKIDVDALVQLAVSGPLEGDSWDPLIDDPDAFGAWLWRINWSMAAREDSDPPQYRYAPLPVAITALEGLKQIAYFVYQSADFEQQWRRDGLDTLLDRLRDELISRIPGWGAAPWGWAASTTDWQAMVDRPAPRGVVAEPSHEESAGEARLRALWAPTGLPLDISYELALTRQIQLVGDPRLVLAGGSHRPEGHLGLPAVEMVLLADSESAGVVFNDRVRQYQRFGGFAHVHVYRFDTLVVWSALQNWYGHVKPEVITGPLTRLEEPEAHWWNDMPPLAEFGVDVLATRVQISPEFDHIHPQHDAYVARTPRELAVLVEMVDDPELREQLARIPTQRKSVVLLQGTAQLAGKVRAELHAEAGSIGLSDVLGYRLELFAESATSSLASVLIVDRLSQVPQTLQLLANDQRDEMICQWPPGSHGDSDF